MVEKTMIVRNETGLHLRPATELSNLCLKMDSEIKLIHKGKTINPKSVLLLMGAGIKQGSEITIQCKGPNEAEDLNQIVEMINGGFGEKMLDL